MSIDWTKPLETREGRPVKYIAKINSKNYPRVCSLPELESLGYGEQVAYFTEDGRVYDSGPESKYDLRNAAEPEPLTDAELKQMVFLNCVVQTPAGVLYLVTGYHAGEVRVGSGWASSERLLKEYKWPDGSPIRSGSVENSSESHL